jgi:hypothetical protein
MGSDIIKEADDRKLIKNFVCNPGLRNVMWEDTKGTKDEVEKICGPSGKQSGGIAAARAVGAFKAAGNRAKEDKERETEGTGDTGTTDGADQ